MDQESNPDGEGVVRGYLDAIAGGQVHGWTWRPSTPSDRLSVRLEVDGVIVQEAVADRLREDLKEAGIGDGAHAFMIEIPSEYHDGSSHQLEVFEAISGTGLPNSPQVVVLETAPASQQNASAPSRIRKRATSKTVAADSSVQGFLDPIEKGVATGWARNREQEDAHLSVDILVDDRLAATVVANAVRDDLLDRGIGAHGFRWEIDQQFADGVSHKISVRACGQGSLLKGSPRSFVLVDASGSGSRDPVKPHFMAGRFVTTAAISALLAHAYSGAEPPEDLAFAIGQALEQSPLGAVQSSTGIDPKELAARISAPERDDSRQVHLLIDARGATQESLDATLASWALQFSVEPPVLLTDPSAAEAWVHARLKTVELDGWRPPLSGHVIFANAGDSFHPHLADLVRGSPTTAGGIVWNLALQGPDENIAAAVLDRSVPRVCGAGYAIGPVGFAAPCKRLAQAPEGVLPVIFAQFRLTQGDWFHISETLSSTRIVGTPAAVMRGWTRQSAEQAERLGEQARHAEVIGLSPHTLIVPRHPPCRVGVALSMAAGVDPKAALSSLTRQVGLANIDLAILSPIGQDAGGSITRENIAKLLPGADIQIVRCPSGMNEAAQFNFAASHLSSPVIVFMSTTARLDHRHALEAMAAWARGEQTGVVLARAAIEHSTGPQPLEAPRIRMTRAGRSDRFICSAMSRTTWLKVGEFDDLSFPQLFDVEWALRAESLGLENIVLNRITARTHGRPSSGRPYERSALRALYPARGFAAPDGDVLTVGDRADARAKFLAQALLDIRRGSLRRRQDMAAELLALSELADDFRRAVDKIGVKLEYE